MHKQRKQTSAVALVLLAALVVGITLFSRSGSLPVGARKVPGTDNTLNISTPWRSAHEVFVYDGSQAAVVDTRIGTKTPVPTFGGDSIHTGLIRFSPDGRWLLWASGTLQKPLWRVAQVGTANAFQRPRDPKGIDLNYAEFLWLDDSQRWAELVRTKTGTYAWIYHVNSPVIDKAMLKPGDDLTSLTGRSRPVYLAPPPEMGGNSWGTTAVSHVFSPRGDQVAWLTSTEDHSLNLAYYYHMLVSLHHFPHFHPSSYRSDLWVSQSDGSKARKIGSFYDDAPLVCLNWTPDGSHLSFNYQNALWTVPVEKSL